MYDRYLFIGLGGSGGSTLGHLKESVRSWLEQHDLDTNIPAGWQFLHIDTPTASDASPRLPEDEYVGLIGSGVQFTHVQQMLDGDLDLHNELQTWRVDPAALGVGIGMGAGQFRAIGQTVSIAYAKTIRQRIAQSVQRLSGAQAKAEIGEIYGGATGETAGPTSNLRIVVVSSLAGGTGAGLLQTVCDIIRAMDTEAGDQIFGVLYTPEVFKALGGASTGGVQPNSLAAISELLNGYWWNGAANTDGGGFITEPKENAAMIRAGLPKALMASGPSYPFLVGRVGQGGVDHGTPKDLFSMVGRSLLSWVTDAKVQKEFIAFTVGNWQSSAMNHLMGPGTLVDEGMDQEKGFPSFSALGFSRLSTGADQFETYCARRLVRDALDQAARYHVDSEMARTMKKQHDTEDPDEIAEFIASEHLMSFIKRCGLSELGPDENDILNALRPTRSDEIKEEFRTKTEELTGLRDGTSRRAEDWRSSLSDSLNSALPGFTTAYQGALEETTASWIPAVQSRSVDAVEEMVSRYGLKATSAMCTKTATKLRTEIAEELRNVDYHNNNQWSSSWQTYSDSKLEGTWGRKLESDDERLQEALNMAIHMAGLQGEAMIAERAASLADDVARRIFGPLTRALEDALYRSDGDLEEAGQWPAWSDAAPPQDIAPPPSEFVLIRPDEYDDLFEEKLADSISEDLSGAIREEIRASLLSGDFVRRQFEEGDLDDAEELLCVAIENDWWPSPQSAHGMLKSPMDLSVRVNVDIERLEARTRMWLRRPGSVFGDFLATSLRSYLGALGLMDAGQISEREYDKRQKRFYTQLKAAMDGAQPLINLDQGLMGRVHPNSSGVPRRNFSQLPFSGHPIEDAVKARLSAGGVGDSVISELLTSDDSIKHVDITTSLDAPHSILVIQSLLQPISESWAEYVASGHTQTFWSRRRARPIADFIPAPQALISCMVRGWFTGVLLGLIDRGSSSSPVRIARIDAPNAGPAEFPFPFLSNGHGQLDRLPLVLEALGLAYVMVSQEGTLTPLNAYCALRDLGRAEKDAQLYGYHQLNPALSNWIADGSNPEKIAEPFLPSGDDPAERLTSLISLLEESKEQYGVDFDHEREKWRNNPSMLSGPPQWTGLWRVIARELGMLISAAESQSRLAGGRRM